MSTLDLDLDYTQIDVGLIANDGTGSSFRTSGRIINQNAIRTMANFDQVTPCIEELTAEVARLTAIIERIDTAFTGDSTGTIVTVPTALVFFQYAVLSVSSIGGNNILRLAEPATLTTYPMIGMADSIGDGTNLSLRTSGIIVRPGTVAGEIYYLSDGGTIVAVTGTPEPAQRLVGLGVATDRFLVRLDNS